MEKVYITVLGSGTCVPSLKRSSCSVLIQINQKKMLFDIGPGTTHRLLQTGLKIFDVSHIFLSHFHPDHTGELASFLFSFKYADSGHPKNPLTLIGGTGLSTFYEDLRNAFRHWIDLVPGQLDLIEMDIHGKDSIEFEFAAVESIPVDHNDESIAYKIKTPDGISVVYSGDTDYCENLITIAQNADLLILESSFPDQYKIRGHLVPSMAGEIAQKAGVRKLMLTHFYPECDSADIISQCRKAYDGPLILAQDLMTVPLGKG